MLLAEIHGSLVLENEALELFSVEEVKAFKRKFPKLCKNPGFLGRGNPVEYQRRVRLSSKKIPVAEKALRKLAWIPWIVFAGITGSVAFLNAEKGDDIDIFMVVQKNRLWITRLLEYVILGSMKIRKTFGQSDESDKLCMNFYISEENLGVGKYKEDFMTALELIKIRPILHKDYLRAIFYQNLWLKQYFVDLPVRAFDYSPKKPIPVISYLGDGVDFLAMQLQISYMKLRDHPIGGSTLERNCIKFYDKEIWKKREKELKNKLKEFSTSRKAKGG